MGFHMIVLRKSSISVGVPGGPLGFMRLIWVGILHAWPVQSSRTCQSGLLGSGH